MTYIFEQFKTEITNPTISAYYFLDNPQAKTVNVSIDLFCQDAKMRNVEIGIFNYIDTWEDVDIEAWVAIELIKHEA